MTVDYYMLKKGNLSLTDLFNGSPASRYWFVHGVNYRAVITVVLALIPCLPSFAAQIAPNGLGFAPNSTAYNFFYISFTFTWVFAGVLYYISYLIFPEKGENVVERTLKFEQWADDNDEQEKAEALLGIAEDGKSVSDRATQGNEKNVSMFNTDEK
jgi:NCS1 family nucleobase:cation symporter-1